MGDIIDSDLVKHGLWIIFTLIWLMLNIFLDRSHGGFMYRTIFRFTWTTICYLVFWIMWLIIY